MNSEYYQQTDKKNPTNPKKTLLIFLKSVLDKSKQVNMIWLA